MQMPLHLRFLFLLFSSSFRSFFQSFFISLAVVVIIMLVVILRFILLVILLYATAKHRVNLYDRDMRVTMWHQ